MTVPAWIHPNLVDKIVAEIDDMYAKFREERVDVPVFILLGPVQRYALKLYNMGPLGDPKPEPVEWMGMKIIPLEKIILPLTFRDEEVLVIG